MPQLEFPDHIAHTPVFLVPYFDHDPGAEGDTDAQFLSVGWSQWDDEQPSAKVVRHSGERWSRQSEELPLARLIDLTILVALAYARGDRFNTLEAGTLEEQADDIDVAYGSRRDRIGLIAELRESQLLRTRLAKLHEILGEADAADLL